MSNLVVNTITPHTTANIDIEGISVPTYLGQDLALDTEVVKIAGSTMTGPLVLNANAAAALVAVPKQQLDTAVSTLNSTISNLGSSHSFVANGHYTAPGGLVVQWASVAVADAPQTSQTVTWPIPFPNDCLKVAISFSVTAGGYNNISVALTGYGPTAATFQVQEWSSQSNPCTVNFIAVGY